MNQPDETIDCSDIPEIREIPANAVRGKFYKPNAVISIPVYLDQEIQAFLMEKAATKGVDLGRLVNELLKHDIEAFHTLG